METANQRRKKISVLGLGQMGRKISRLYSDAGYAVTVWNRTPGKANALGNVQLAQTAEEAIVASPLIILIIYDNKGTLEIIEGLTNTRIFKEKTLVNFTTGSPAEAESIGKILSGAGGSYIHGAIQAAPDQLGLESVIILSSGNREAFDRCVGDLTIIGGNIRHLSEQAAASSAMDTATSMWVYGAFLGLMYGAEFSRQYGLALNDYATIIGEIAPEFIRYFKYEIGVIDRNDFRVTQSSVSTHLPVVQRLADSFKEVNVRQEFPTLLRDILAEAERKGLGEEELAAISKIIAGRP